MALPPEDVIKKSFSATHLRRGYDETQVDDFLDEVVVELRRMLADQDELAAQLEECRSGKYDGGAEGGAAALAGGASLDEEQLAQVRAERAEIVAELEQLSGQLDGRRAEVEEAEAAAERRIEAARAKAAEAESAADEELQGRLEGELKELQRKVEQTRGEAQAAEAHLAELQQQIAQAKDPAGESEGTDSAEHATAAAPLAAAAPAAAGEDPTKIISLAQRLHDQHVADGEESKQRLIGEGEDYRDRVVKEANETKDTLIREGQETHDELIATGQAEHDKLVNTGQQTHDQLVAQGQAEHDKLVGEGTSRRDTLVGEAEVKRANILADLESKQTSLSARIDELTSFEGDYRDKLRGYLTEQMGFLDRNNDGIDDRLQ